MGGATLEEWRAVDILQCSPLHAKKALMYGSAQGIARKHHLCIVGSK